MRILYGKVPAHMTDAVLEKNGDAADLSADLRVYEIGYHILPTVKEEDVESVVAGIRAFIEKAGGSFIAEGAPVSIKLAYTMFVSNEGKRTAFDRAYFGWIKCELEGSAAYTLAQQLETDKQILRSIVFKTVREDTRAVARHSVLREVKRGETIKSTPTKGAEQAVAGEVSEEQLDKSIDALIEE